MKNSAHRDLKDMGILLLITCFVVSLLAIATLANFLNTSPDLVPILTLNSPDNNYIAKVYLISSDKMEGSSLSVNVYNRSDKLLREDIYRQWYCVNAAIRWKSNDELTINGVTLNRQFDSVTFITKPTDICPSSSLIY
jgi:hypothetical protein